MVVRRGNKAALSKHPPCRPRRQTDPLRI